MKIVELKLEEGNTGEGITAISLVKHPAIEKNWVAFSDNPEMVAKPDKRFAFKTIDEEQRIVAGPAMIPDKLIYRIDPDGEEYFVFFTVDTIRELSEGFLYQGKQNNMTLEHESTLNGLSVVESWLVEDPEKDKSAMYGFELPVGSWFVKVKVLNDDVWELVKEDAVSGFSVEGVFTSELIKNSKPKMKAEKLDGYLAKIRSLFNTEEAEAKEETAGTDPTTKETTDEKFGTVEAEGANGVVVISFPGDMLEAGAAITHEVDGEQVPVPTGEYVLTDGSILVVVEEGIAGEVRPAEAVEEAQEEEMETDDKPDKMMEALVDGIAEILSNFKSDMEAKFASAVKAETDKLRAEFNKPAAEVEDETPETERTKKTVVQGLNKFVKEQKTK